MRINYTNTSKEIYEPVGAIPVDVSKRITSDNALRYHIRKESEKSMKVKVLSESLKSYTCDLCGEKSEVVLDMPLGGPWETSVSPVQKALE